jgi:hypothetical protein
LLKNRLIVGAAGLLVLLCGAAGAAEEWRWEITPYAWFTDVDGAIVLEGDRKRLGADFEEMWEYLNVGLKARAEAWKGNLGLFGDIYHTGLEDRVTIDDVRITPSVDIFLTDWGVIYNLGRIPIGVEQPQFGVADERLLSYGASAGIRYFHLKNRVDSVPGRSVSQTGQFIEPILGLYARYRAAERVEAVAMADFGGFGIGSKLTWNAVLRMDFRFTEYLWGNMIYRVFDIDYEEGSGSDKIGLDAQLSGPGIGLGLRF